MYRSHVVRASAPLSSARYLGTLLVRRERPRVSLVFLRHSLGKDTSNQFASWNFEMQSLGNKPLRVDSTYVGEKRLWG